MTTDAVGVLYWEIEIVKCHRELVEGIFDRFADNYDSWMNRQ